MNQPNVTGATRLGCPGVLTAAFTAAYTFHITIKDFRRAETVCIRKRRNRWTRRIRTTSWNSRRRARSCTCPSVQQIRTSTFRPTVIAKPAGSPVGCVHSRCSAGSAPRIFPASKGVRTLRNRANEAGDTWGGVARFSVLSSCCAPPCVLQPPVSMACCGVCRARGMVCSEPPDWRAMAPQPCQPVCCPDVCPAAVSMACCGVCRAPGMVCSKPPDWWAASPQPCQPVCCPAVARTRFDGLLRGVPCARHGVQRTPGLADRVAAALRGRLLPGRLPGCRFDGLLRGVPCARHGVQRTPGLAGGVPQPCPVVCCPVVARLPFRCFAAGCAVRAAWCAANLRIGGRWRRIPARSFVARPFARLPFRWLAAGCAVRAAWCAANLRIGGRWRRIPARSFVARPFARLPFRWLAAGCAVRAAWCAVNPWIGGPWRRNPARVSRIPHPEPLRNGLARGAQNPKHGCFELLFLK